MNKKKLGNTFSHQYFPLKKNEAIGLDRAEINLRV